MISRSNQYENKKQRPKFYKRKEDGVILNQILSVIKDRASYGYPRVTVLVNRQRRNDNLAPINRKRTYRIMKMNNLLLPRGKKRVTRVHDGRIVVLKSNIRYCSDIFNISCWDGGIIRVAFSLDCCDREVMSFVAQSRPLTHRDIIQLMDQTVVHRFGDSIERLPYPIEWLSDQGPQYTSIDTISYARDWGFIPITTPSYSPESNGMAEVFIRNFKTEYVYASDLWDVESVMKMLPQWFSDYNQNRPHSGLKFMTPLEYRETVLFNQNLSV